MSRGKKATQLIALIIAGLSLMAAAGIKGYYEGSMADVNLERLRVFAPLGQNIYDYLGNRYVIILAAGLTLYGLSWCRRSIQSLCIGVGAMLGIILVVSQLLLYKLDVGFEAVLSYRKWFDWSFYLDYFLVLLAAAGLTVLFYEIHQLRKKKST